MARVAQRFLEAFAHPACESFRQSGRAPGSLERNQRRETRHVKFLRFGERLNRDQFPFAQNARRFHIFVDQTFHRKNQLVVERRHGFFRQPSHIKFQRIGTPTQSAHQLSAKNRSHTRRKSAVGSDGHIALLRLAGQRQFLPNHRVVSAEIGKVAARLNGRLRQPKIQPVRHRGERTIMAAHQLSRSLLTARVERDCAHFLVASDLVYPRRNLASAFQVVIGE